MFALTRSLIMGIPGSLPAITGLLIQGPKSERHLTKRWILFALRQDFVQMQSELENTKQNFGIMGTWR